MRSMVLVHSPLLGPSSWSRCAEVLHASGRRAVVPDLRRAFASDANWSSAVAAACVGAGPSSGEIVLVGHSGAGNYLPVIGDAIGMSRVSFVFVDAVLPPRAGTITPGEGVGDLLGRHSTDGWLEPWLDWWSDDVIERMLPDPADRVSLEQDMPRLRTAVYDEIIDVPPGWQDREIRYVQTSLAYVVEADEARSRGCPLVRIDGTHLSIVTESDNVVRHILGQE